MDPAVLGACLIGAQKCATSSLASWLEGHPGICHSVVKEPQFWTQDRSSAEVGQYLDEQFGHARSGELLVEASTGYSMYPEFVGVPERIHAHNPDLRVLYLVRDPVRRAESHLVHNWLNGHIDHVGLDVALADPSYLDRSRYWMQLERFLALFDSSQVHVVLLEDLSTAGARTFAEIEAFLGVARRSPTPPLPKVRGASRSDGFWEGERVLMRVGVHLPHRAKRAVRLRYGRKRPDVVLDAPSRFEVRRRLEPDIEAFEEFLGRSTGWATGT